MSNLSDLLPAGGGAKVITATASGTIASGKPVVLNSDGTVSQVAQTAAGVGSEAVYNSAQGNYNSVAYDATNDRIVAAYYLNSNNYGYAVVGSVSGTTITWGTPVVFKSHYTLDVCIAAGGGKVLIGYSSNSEGYYRAYVIVGTVSGTSISFGSEVALDDNQGADGDLAYCPTRDRFAYAYSKNGGRISLRMISISGTTPSNAGGEYEPNGSTNGGTPGLAAFASGGQDYLVLVYKNTASSSRATYNVAQVTSGSSYTALSLGSAGVVGTNNITRPRVAYDASTTHVMMAYKANNSSGELQIRGGSLDLSGKTVSWGTAVAVSGTAGVINNYGIDVAYDSNAQKVTLAYSGSSSTGQGTVNSVTLSGSGSSVTATLGTTILFNGSSGLTDYISVAYNSTLKNNAIVFTDQSNSNYGTGVVYSDISTNLTATNFLGLADAAISDTATGKINVKGSINSKQSSLTIGSDYYVQSDGSVSTTSTSPAVKIGQAVNATTINMMDLT